MKVILLKISESKKSKHGGVYKRCFFKNTDNKSFFLDVYDSHTLSKRWLPFLKVEAMFENVNIFTKNIIDGTSNFKYIGQRHETK